MNNLNSEVRGFRPWLVWGLAAAFFFAEYFARVAPSVMVPQLMDVFHVDAFSLGSLSAMFYYAYVAMQIPVGTLVDKYGPKRLLTVAALLCGLSCLFFAMTHSLFVANVCRFTMGFTAAFAFVGALKLASVWFSPLRFGLLAGATQAIGMLGAATGEGPVSWLVQEAGWRDTMSGIGGVLLFIGVLIAFFVRDRPFKAIAVEDSAAKKVTRQSILKSLLTVLKNPQTWINAIFIGFLYAPTAAFGEFWGATYLKHVHHLPETTAAFAISMIFIGWMIFGPIGGFISDKIKRRKPIMLISAVGSLLAISVVLYAPGLSTHAIFILLFIYGGMNVGVATSYTVACEINPREVAGTSMSFTNMASVLVGALFQPIIGKILVRGWDHTVVNNIPVYSAHDYRLAMVALPVCTLVSLVVLPFLKESCPKA